MNRPWDLNCDLGEGEPLSRTRALMAWITSANIACGGHAGTVRTMTQSVRCALERGVRIGAHPGWPSRSGFGRGELRVSTVELETLLIHQISALETIARREDAPLHHVKLHGALYHATEAQPALRRCYVRTIRQWWPDLTVYALAGGKVLAAARQAGLRTMAEGFLDRAYLKGSRLLPRTEPGALWSDLKMVEARWHAWRRHGTIELHAGGQHPLKVDTWCVHGDTPGALRLVRSLARLMFSTD